MTIFFDMDGTIADLYAVNNWLPKLRAFDASPYEEAKPLVDMNELSTLCQQLQDKGIRIGIITWLSKDEKINRKYNKEVRKTKREWLGKHFKIKFDEVHMVKYGYPKRKVAGKKGDILIDDNAGVCEAWQGKRKPNRKAVYCKDRHTIIIHELNQILNTPT